MPTCRENIERGLKHLGLDTYLTITKSDIDRVWAWPLSGLEPLLRDTWGWEQDPRWMASKEHGAGTRSYREPDGVHPAMQICFHPSPTGDFAEIDFDLAAPVDVVDGIRHLEEVIQNAVTHKTTDQAEVASLLDRRFGVG